MQAFYERNQWLMNCSPSNACKYKITTFQSQQVGISTQFQFATILDKNQNWHENNNFKSFQIISTGHFDQQEILDQGPRNNTMAFKSHKARLKMNRIVLQTNQYKNIQS